MIDKKIIIILLLAIAVIGFALILDNCLVNPPVFGLSMEEAKQIAAESCDDRNCTAANKELWSGTEKAGETKINKYR